MPTLTGIFVLGELTGPVADELQAITERADPKLARLRRPHITLAGSSGLGPIAADTPIALLRERLTPVAEETAPLVFNLGPVERFPGTEIVVLPIAPRGPIRALHDRIASTGLHFARPRFAFSPHVTLNLYRTLTPKSLRTLMGVCVTESVTLHRLHVYLTNEPTPARLLLDMPLTGTK